MAITLKEALGVLTSKEKTEVERLEKVIDEHIRESCSFGQRIWVGWTINLGYIDNSSSSIHVFHELARRYVKAGWQVRFEENKQRDSIIILSMT